MLCVYCVCRQLRHSCFIGQFPHVPGLTGCFLDLGRRFSRYHMQWMSMSEFSKLLTSEILNFAPTADIVCSFLPQCFDAVGWASERASGV